MFLALYTPQQNRAVLAAVAQRVRRETGVRISVAKLAPLAEPISWSAQMYSEAATQLAAAEPDAMAQLLAVRSCQSAAPLFKCWN